MSLATLPLQRAPLLAPVPPDLTAVLHTAISDAADVHDRAIDRLAYANDASHYSLTPLSAVTPRSASEVSRLLRAAAIAGTSVTFRSGGTSLSGQAVTDAILVDTRRHFRHVEVLDDGQRVRVQPGMTVRQVNARLLRHGRKLGPDPASEIACTLGGVIANNSSGMACGVEQNTYNTLESAVLVLANGAVVDTATPDADDVLRAAAPKLHEGLARLRDRVRANPGSVAEIRRLFAMKNSMGYSLNAFLDHDRPAQILVRLAIGSEGTLCFVAEATLRTVPLLPLASTSLLFFDNLRAAAAALPALVETLPKAIELLDAESLRVARDHTRTDGDLHHLAITEHAALLVEYQATTLAELTESTGRARRILANLTLALPASFTTDASSRASLWNMRKGLYAAVAGARPTGTTALLEDVVVPLAELVPVVEGLTALFERHGYERSAVFGHAKDGNLHFMLNEHFGSPEDVDRYRRFTDDMVDLVLAHGGSLKAEHGTGRIMAPFLRRQYGDELYEVIREIKAVTDPDGVLNPGVVVSDDPKAHLRNLKVTPTVEAEVDRCVECGYCEPVCPSRDLTTTPRQRIVLRRAIARARDSGDLSLARELENDYAYDGVDTCAVDGMCQTVCPVDINTGDLVRRMRAESNGAIKNAGWHIAAGHWRTTTKAAAAALNAAAAFPPRLVQAASRAARRLGGAENVPSWSPELPRGGRARPVLQEPDPDAVYFPSCLSAMFAPVGANAGGCGAAGDDAAASSESGVVGAFLRLCAKAGVRLLTPEGIDGLCCATPWKSKGLPGGHGRMRARASRALRVATRGGELPVVVDAASCTEGLAGLLAEGTASPIRVLDAVEFVADYVLPRLAIERKLPSLALHLTCSSTRRDMNETISALATAVADDVVVPDDWGCCAFAGDRGLLHPELTKAATAPETGALAARSFAAYASCNRTCEIGMSIATGHAYRHILEIVADAAGAKNPVRTSVAADEHRAGKEPDSLRYNDHAARVARTEEHK